MLENEILLYNLKKEVKEKVAEEKKNEFGINQESKVI